VAGGRWQVDCGTVSIGPESVVSQILCAEKVTERQYLGGIIVLPTEVVVR
jgi:hypothetical protein